MGPRDRKRNLIVLKHRSDDTTPIVTQRDLEELLYLERQMKDAADLWKIKRDAIRRCVELGCTVEPGLREARIDVLVQDANGEHPKSSARLVVR